MSTNIDIFPRRDGEPLEVHSSFDFLGNLHDTPKDRTVILKLNTDKGVFYGAESITFFFDDFMHAYRFQAELAKAWTAFAFPTDDEDNEDDNAGCDQCGVQDRAYGSVLCTDCLETTGVAH